jgi:fermentation-respiration switch protein FrsA (DUF1100 family)
MGISDIALVNAMAFPVPPVGHECARLRKRKDVVWLGTKSDEQIPCLFITPKLQGACQPFLLLYSHGNSEDLGEGAEYLEYMAAATGCSVLGYEYVGYGVASGKPSEKGLYESADAAYEWATRPVAEEGLGWPAECIVPFGRSLGSAAAVHLASAAAVPCAGLLLQSPLMSGAQVLLGRTAASLLMCVDIFKNYARIQRARCAVAIVHGAEDDVVPVSNGRALAARCAAARGATCWEIEEFAGRGHNDMEPERVLAFAARFLNHLADQHAVRSATGAI